MTPDGNGAGRPQRQKNGTHKKGRARTRTARTYAAVAGGAIACTGVAFGVSTPIAEAFSIVIPVNSGGSGNSVQINILEGNVFDPQLGLLTGNYSNNTTSGGIATGQGNGTGLIGPAAGSSNGNVTQINILSYNIINPQASIFGSNISNNTTVSNVSVGNGNNNASATDATSAPGGLLGSMLMGGMTGNGNTTQLAFLSGNITNPQFTLFGSNFSNNTAATNVAADNGNGSTQYLSAGYLSATFLGMTGNGNTTQVAAGTSNIFNQQFSFGGGNSSNNSSTTNSSDGNGNYSSTGGTGGLFGNTTIFGQTGNGNSSQTSTGSGTIANDQYNFGIGNLLGALAPAPAPTVQQQAPTNPQASGTNSVVTASSTQSDTTAPVVVTDTSTPADTTTTSNSPASSSSAGSRITTVVNSLSGNLKPGSTPLIPSTGGPGATGHFSIPEPIKKILASIPGMPSASPASASPAASGSDGASAGTG